MSKAVPTIDVLRAARKLVANEETWCRNRNAVDARDESVDSDDASAVRWCVVGATLKVAREADLGSECQDAALNALSRASRLLFAMGPQSANDHLGRLAALSIIDAAIAELGEAP